MHTDRNAAVHPSYINNYHLKSEVNCAVLCRGVVAMYVCVFFCIYTLPGSLLFQFGTPESGPPFSLVCCHTFMTLSSSSSITLHCWLSSTRYTAVQIKNCLKGGFAIKIATMINTDNEGKLSCAIAKLTLFTFNKDELYTKEDTGKSMKNALYVLQYAKRYLLGKTNVKQ